VQRHALRGQQAFDFVLALEGGQRGMGGGNAFG